MPNMPPNRLGATNWRIKPGAGVHTSRKPAPSKARSTSKLVAVCAHPPRDPAPKSMRRPAIMQRLSPMPSARRPTASPSVMPANCTMESRNPACTKVMPSNSRSTGKAGNSLATCRAALTPARMTTTAGAMPLRPEGNSAAFTTITTTVWHPSGARAHALRSGQSCRQCSRR